MIKSSEQLNVEVNAITEKNNSERNKWNHFLQSIFDRYFLEHVRSWELEKHIKEMKLIGGRETGIVIVTDFSRGTVGYEFSFLEVIKKECFKNNLFGLKKKQIEHLDLDLKSLLVELENKPHLSENWIKSIILTGNTFENFNRELMSAGYQVSLSFSEHCDEAIIKISY